MSTSKQNIVDIIQWILIISLTIVLICCYIWTHKRIVAEEKYEKVNTYTKIYESQNFDRLKKKIKDYMIRLKVFKTSKASSKSVINIDIIPIPYGLIRIFIRRRIAFIVLAIIMTL